MARDVEPTLPKKPLTDKVLVEALLGACGELRWTYPPWRAETSWDSLMTALRGTTHSLVALFDPDQRPRVTEIRVTDGNSSWTISSEGLEWAVSEKRSKPRGRPRRDIQTDEKVADLYKKVLRLTKELKRELKDHYNSKHLGRKTRGDPRRAIEKFLQQDHPRTKVWDLSRCFAPSGHDQLATLVCLQRRPTKIQWSDYLAGHFAPRELALVVVGHRFSLAPDTIRNILKSKRTRKR